MTAWSPMIEVTDRDDRPPDRRLTLRSADELLTRSSSSAAGSSDRPVWTSDGWMIVLAGETSQWNRSAGSNRAIGPAAGSPAAIRSIASRCERTVARSRSGATAASPRLVELDPRPEVAPRPAQQDHADVELLAALDARHDADHRVLEDVSGGAGTLGLLDERARRREPPLAGSRRRAARWAVGVAGDRVGREPRVRDVRDDRRR